MNGCKKPPSGGFLLSWHKISCIIITIMDKKIQKIAEIIAVVILIAVGFYVYRNYDVGNSQYINIQNEETFEKGLTSEKEEVSNVDAVQNVGSNVITVTDTPNLDKEIVFDGGMTEEVKSILFEKIKTTIVKLKADNKYVDGWIDLGLYRKAIGDYDGAREVWEYAVSISPSNGLPNRNLGDLYGYYLQDAQKAEENFLKAIKKDPEQIEYYFKIVEFYRDIVKDTTRARKVVEKGILLNPNSEELKALLKTL